MVEQEDCPGTGRAPVHGRPVVHQRAPSRHHRTRRCRGGEGRMNPDHDHQQQEPRRRPPVPETGHPPSTPAEKVETPPVEKTETPEAVQAARTAGLRRSEERRVGKECRAGWARGEGTETKWGKGGGE